MKSLEGVSLDFDFYLKFYPTYFNKIALNGVILFSEI